MDPGDGRGSFGVRRLDLVAEIRPPVPTALTVSALLERAVVAGPDRAAVRDPRGAVTYRDLQARARAVAGTVPGAGLVLVLAVPGTAEITGILGAVLAGRPYVALDRTAPVAALRSLCARFAGAVLLVDAESAPTAAQLGHDGPVVDLSASSGDREPAAPKPDDVGMVSWTSGTTGQPKGVMHSNRSMVSNALRVRDGLGLRPDDRILAVAPMSFVGGTTPVLASLAAGSTLCQYVMAFEGVSGWNDFVVLAEPTVVFTGPGRARFFAAEARRSGPAGSVRLVVVGGDRFLATHVRDLTTAFPEARIVQRYNLSETNWVAGCEIVPREAEGSDELPIGWPVPWLEVGVNDGSATVTGDCLAIGYWDDAERTQRSFTGPPERRTFRTGDRLVEGSDGLLWFNGRRDRETKVNGVRVDPVEVEHELTAVEGVTQAAVVATRGDGDVMRLAAFVVADQTISSGAAVRRAVSATLPAVKVPATIDLVAELPITARGKVDLHELAKRAGKGPSAHPEPPRNELERAVAEVIGRVLQRDKVGRDEDLFALGADSLDTEEIAIALEPTLGRLLPSDLLAHPTPAELAMLAAVRGDESHVIRARRGSGALLPLLLIPGGGGAFVETMAALGRETGDRDILVPVPRGFARREVPDRSIEAMAGSVVDDLLPITGNAPVAVAGYSSGGVVAFEVARRLVDRGVHVPVLVIIDSAAPGDPGPSGDSARTRRRLARDLELRLERPGKYGAMRAAVLSRFRPRRWWRAWTAGLLQRSAGQQQLTFSTLRGSAIDRFRPLPYDGQAVILCAVGTDPLWSSGAVGQPTPNLARWRSHLVREPRFVSVSGTHEDIVRGIGRAHTAAVLSEILREHDDRGVDRPAVG